MNSHSAYQGLLLYPTYNDFHRTLKSRYRECLPHPRRDQNPVAHLGLVSQQPAPAHHFHARSPDDICISKINLWYHHDPEILVQLRTITTSRDRQTARHLRTTSAQLAKKLNKLCYRTYDINDDHRQLELVVIEGGFRVRFLRWCGLLEMWGLRNRRCKEACEIAGKWMEVPGDLLACFEEVDGLKAVADRFLFGTGEGIEKASAGVVGHTGNTRRSGATQVEMVNSDEYLPEYSSVVGV